MTALRTTVSNHKKRLPLLFDTWITKVNSSQLFLVTDGDDPFARLVTTVTGMYYYIVACVLVITSGTWQTKVSVRFSVTAN